VKVLTALKKVIVTPLLLKLALIKHTPLRYKVPLILLKYFSALLLLRYFTSLSMGCTLVDVNVSS